jgi:cytochrome c oxidase subunit IV
MSDADDIKKHVRIYVWVCVALMAGTLITVAVSYIPDAAFERIRVDGHTGHIVVALLIASVKAFLVAGYFMHLLSERKLIYSLLVVTGIFFAGLMYLTWWSMEPDNIPHIRADDVS